MCMSTRKVSITFRQQRNGQIQVFDGDDIELVGADDHEALGKLVIEMVKDGVSSARDPEPTPPSTDNEVIEAEFADEADFRRAQDAYNPPAPDVEGNVRAALDGVMPGASRILDFMQSISSED
jgi:hypothetical protein